MKKLTLIVVLLGLVFGNTFGQGAKASKKLLKTLNKTDLSFETTDDGDFRITIAVENGRTHLVFLTSQMNEYNGAYVSDLYGFSIVSNSDSINMLSDTYQDLLIETARTTVGSWGIYYSDDKTQAGIAYIAKITSNVTSEELKAHIFGVALIADSKELEWEKSGFILETDQW